MHLLCAFATLCVAFRSLKDTAVTIPRSNTFFIPPEHCLTKDLNAFGQNSECFLLHHLMPTLYEDVYNFNFTRWCHEYPTMLRLLGINGMFMHIKRAISMHFELLHGNNDGRIPELLRALNQIHGYEVALAHGAYTYLVAHSGVAYSAKLVQSIVPSGYLSLNWAHLTGHGVLLREIVRSGFSYSACERSDPVGRIITQQNLNMAASACDELGDSRRALYCMDDAYMSWYVWQPLVNESFAASVCTSTVHQNDRCFARLAQHFEVTLLWCNHVPHAIRHHCINGTAFERFLPQIQLPHNGSFFRAMPHAVSQFCTPDSFLVACIQGVVHGVRHALHYRYFVEIGPSVWRHFCHTLQRLYATEITNACLGAVDNLYVDLVPTH